MVGLRGIMPNSSASAGVDSKPLLRTYKPVGSPQAASPAGSDYDPIQPLTMNSAHPFDGPGIANFKVKRALSWYAENLCRHPSVTEVAAVVEVSTSHLRRLFWQVRRTSPKVAFQHIRLEKARDLMGRTALTLHEIARRCGYTSSSHFCREYRTFHHTTPAHWRKACLARFNNPVPPDTPFPQGNQQRLQGDPLSA